MSNEELKPWWTSKAIIGSCVSILSLVAGAVGYNIGAEDQEAIVLAVTTVGAAVGSVVAIYGRVKATRKVG